jgi:endopolyphosphatase
VGSDEEGEDVEDPSAVEFEEAIKKRKGKGHRHDKPKDDCSKPENEDKPHCTFKKKPRYYSKHSPSRTNSPLSPLGYTQFYLPDVDSSSKKVPEWVIEYTTYKLRNLLPSNSSEESQPLPIPLRLLPGYGPDVLLKLEDEWDLGKQEREDAITGKRKRFWKELKRITPWKMRDLTIPSYVKLARKLVAEKKMWNHFAEIM